MKIDIYFFELIVFQIIYIINIILFPICKRNEFFGLKYRKTNYSEEIWHKIHVRAAYATIPFAIFNLILMFLHNNMIRFIGGFIIIGCTIITWKLIVKYTDRKYFLEIEKKQLQELDEQVKKESGWI